MSPRESITWSAPSARTRIMLVRRRRCDHSRAVVPGHLHGSLAGSAGRGMDENRFSRLDLTERLECGHGGGPGHDHAQGLLVLPPGRHRERAHRRQHHVLGERTTADADTNHVRTWLDPEDTLAESYDLSRGFDPARYGGRGPPAEAPRDCETSR